MKEFTVYIDGAAKGNPGKAGIGIIIYNQQGSIIKKVSEYIGIATNNVAEYLALIYGLQEALILKADRVSLYSDSELVLKQMKGIYRVKDNLLSQLFLLARHLKGNFKKIEFLQVTHFENKEADRLANAALKTK